MNTKPKKNNRQILSFCFLLTFLLACPITQAATYVDEVLADSPLAYYRMQETTGTSVLDSSSNGNTGSYQGITTLEISGPTLPGLPGNLASGYNGDVSGGAFIPATTSRLSVGTLGLGNTFTTEFFFQNLRPASSEPISGYIFSRGGGSDMSIGINGSFVGGDFAGHENELFVLYNGTPYFTGFLPTNGEWNLLSFVYNHTAGEFSLYLNGSSLISSQSVVPLALSGTEIYYGLRTSGAWPYQGNLDEVSIYNSALSSSDISRHYLSTVPEPSTFAMLAAGGMALAICSRRRKAKMNG